MRDEVMRACGIAQGLVSASRDSPGGCQHKAAAGLGQARLSDVTVSWGCPAKREEGGNNKLCVLQVRAVLSACLQN